MPRIALCIIALFLISGCLVPPAKAEPRVKPLGPSVSSEYKNNIFLKASDKQFRPVAEFIMGKGSLCAKAIFVGVTPEDMRGVSGDLRQNMDHQQYYCRGTFMQDVMPIAEASGILKKNNLSLKDIQNRDHVYDPRVYERAKKMMGKAPPAKPKN